MVQVEEEEEEEEEQEEEQQEVNDINMYVSEDEDASTIQSPADDDATADEEDRADPSMAGGGKCVFEGT